MKSTVTGRIQCQSVPVPEVGSQRSQTAKTSTPTIAIQKFGMLAPSKREQAGDPVEHAAGSPGGDRAGHDGDRERDQHRPEREQVSVVGMACSTRSSAGAFWCSDWPKSKRSEVREVVRRTAR